MITILRLSNLVDLDFCVMSTVTMFLAETLPSFHFEGDHLVTLHLSEDLGLDGGLDIFAYRQFTVGVGQQDFCKFELISCISCYPGNVQCLVFLDLELLAGYFYYC